MDGKRLHEGLPLEFLAVRRCGENRRAHPQHITMRRLSIVPFCQLRFREGAGMRLVLTVACWRASCGGPFPKITSGEA